MSILYPDIGSGGSEASWCKDGSTLNASTR